MCALLPRCNGPGTEKRRGQGCFRGGSTAISARMGLPAGSEGLFVFQPPADGALLRPPVHAEEIADLVFDLAILEEIVLPDQDGPEPVLGRLVGRGPGDAGDAAVVLDPRLEILIELEPRLPRDLQRRRSAVVETDLLGEEEVERVQRIVA